MQLPTDNLVGLPVARTPLALHSLQPLAILAGQAEVRTVPDLKAALRRVDPASKVISAKGHPSSIR
jgi:hypothetical protein